METTPESELRKPGNGDLRVCIACGSHELRRANRSIRDRFLFLQPYHCSRCKNRHKAFRMSWLAVITIAAMLSMMAGLVYFLPKMSIFGGSEATAAADADELAKARSAMGGQLSAFEKVLSKRPKNTLDNAEILRLWKAKVGTQVILQMMRTSNGDYDVSPTAVISMREAQVDENIILAMIDQSNRTH